MKIEIQKSAAVMRRFSVVNTHITRRCCRARSYDTHGIADLPPFI